MRVSRNNTAESDQQQLKILELSVTKYEVIMCSLLKKLEVLESMTKEWEYQKWSDESGKNQIEPLEVTNIIEIVTQWLTQHCKSTITG